MLRGVCPSCQKPVRLPELAPETRVRCPLCRSEHRWDSFAESALPTVEVVEPAPATGPKSSDDVVPAEAPPPATEPRVLKPDPASADDLPRLLPTESDLPKYDFRETLPSPAEIAPLIVKSSKHSSRPPSGLWWLLKVVLGGLAGILLAQCILWWLPVPYRTDPLHLAPQLPPELAWMAPGELRGVDPAAAAGPGPADSRPNISLSPHGPVLEGTTGDDPATSSNSSGTAESGSSGEGAPGSGTGNGSADSTLPGDTLPGDRGTEQRDYGILGAEVFSGAELAAALRDAQTATARITVDDERPDEQVQAAWKQAIEALAYRVTFANPLDSLTTAQVAQIEALVQQISREPELRVMLRDQQEAIWSRKSSGTRDVALQGCCLLGRVMQIQPEGPLFLTTVRLDETTVTAPVLSKIDPADSTRPAFQPGDDVAILGTRVVAPDRQLYGYAGEAWQVVWGGLPVVLVRRPGPAEPAPGPE